MAKYLFPSQTTVELAPYVHYMSPEYFVEPDRFLPERWLRDGSALNIHPYLLTPFGHGPRMCAGTYCSDFIHYIKDIVTLNDIEVLTRCILPHMPLSID